MRVEGWKGVVILAMLGMVCRGRTADLVIRVPGISTQQQDDHYRLDYNPPVGSFGSLATNTALKLSDLGDANTSDTWTTAIVTAPESLLTVDIQSETQARLQWRPPSLGKYSLLLVPLSEPSKPVRSIFIKETTSILTDLTPGATYEIQVYSVFEGKASQAYISTNFTTKPKPPSKAIVWFRNETTLLVQWQPPIPAGFYTDYKVSIQPEDALYSETLVTRVQGLVPWEGDPPTPAKAAFNGLYPGRAYNISVSTVSKGQISDPSRVQYRTVPLRPHNVTFDPLSVGSDSFTVRWSAPEGPSEFDRYQVAIGTSRKTPQIVERGKELVASFTENLRPGRTYQVIVTTVTVSGVASWPARGNVTTRPLPVRELRQEVDSETSAVKLTWEPNPDSQQDSFKVRVVRLQRL